MGILPMKHGQDARATLFLLETLRSVAIEFPTPAPLPQKGEGVKGGLTRRGFLAGG